MKAVLRAGMLVHLATHARRLDGCLVCAPHGVGARVVLGELDRRYGRDRRHVLGPRRQQKTPALSRAPGFFFTDGLTVTYFRVPLERDVQP